MSCLGEIGRLLRVERMKRKFTLEDICDMANISYNALWKIENGSDFKMSTFIKLCDVYKINIFGLFTKIENTELNLTSNQIAALKMFLHSLRI